MHPRASDRRAHWPAALSAAVLGLLAACSTPPTTAPAPADPQRDGPPLQPPSDLLSRPEPEPRVEPLRVGGPNKPYEVLGQSYTPMAADLPLAETGLASWYGRKFHGRPTASGETYDMYAFSAAHRTMPLPSWALVRNPANGRELVVRINDRGPFHSDRVIDLSYGAAAKLGVLRGVSTVHVRRLTHDDIRSGRWRDGGVSPTDEVAPTATLTSRPAATPTPTANPTANPTGTATAAAIATATATATPTATVTATTTASATPVAAATTTPVAAVAATPAAATPVAAAPAPAPAPMPAAASSSWWVQLGAFRQPQGAHELRRDLAQQLAWLEPWLTIVDERALYRLQAGPFATRAEAQGTAERIRGSISMQPLLLQRPR